MPTKTWAWAGPHAHVFVGMPPGRRGVPPDCRSRRHSRLVGLLLGRGLGRQSLADGGGGLLLGEAPVVALEDQAILGREAFGDPLEDAVALAAGELRPILVALRPGATRSPMPPVPLRMTESAKPDATGYSSSRRPLQAWHSFSSWAMSSSSSPMTAFSFALHRLAGLRSCPRLTATPVILWVIEDTGPCDGFFVVRTGEGRGRQAREHRNRRQQSEGYDS